MLVLFFYLTIMLYKLVWKWYIIDEATSMYYKIDRREKLEVMKETQLLKGVLEGCVLDMIGQKERYGYELVQTLREAGFDTIVPGTIYPLLQKLEKNQWIRGNMSPSPDGPDRKYFSLTKEGEERVSVFWQQWDDLSQKVEGIKNGS